MWGKKKKNKYIGNKLLLSYQHTCFLLVCFSHIQVYHQGNSKDKNICGEELLTQIETIHTYEDFVFMKESQNFSGS